MTTIVLCIDGKACLIDEYAKENPFAGQKTSHKSSTTIYSPRHYYYYYYIIGTQKDIKISIYIYIYIGTVPGPAS